MRPSPQTKGIPIPEACEYVRLGDREIKVVDGIEVANQLTFRWEIILVYLGKLNAIISFLKYGREMKRTRVAKPRPDLAGFKDRETESRTKAS